MMYAMEKARDRKFAAPVPAPPIPVAAVAVPAPLPVPAPETVPVADPPVADAPLTIRAKLLKDLETNLSSETGDDFLTVSADMRGVVISLNDETLFKPGVARIRPSAVASFDRIGEVLSRYPNHILLVGHTDSMPIHTARFASNWELSMARSMAVMLLLEKRTSIPSSRFSIGGSADNSPVSTDNSAAGRARNRRVEIVVLEAPPEKAADSAASETSRPMP
jgi:chemotaxis protein MotB